VEPTYEEVVAEAWRRVKALANEYAGGAYEASTMFANGVGIRIQVDMKCGGIKRTESVWFKDVRADMMAERGKQPGRDLPPIIGRLEEQGFDNEPLVSLVERHGIKWTGTCMFVLRVKERLREKVTEEAALADKVGREMFSLGVYRATYRRDETGRWRLRTEADDGWEDDEPQ
jgi:hypothetical protein